MMVIIFFQQEQAMSQHPKSEQAAHAFMRPRRPETPKPLILKGCETLQIHTPEGQIAVQRVGTGPAVLLAHGWEGQASDLAAFVQPLLDAGFSVLAMHLLGHGQSSGQTSSIPQAARALVAVGSQLGPFHAAIAHSVGSAVLVEAMHAGLVVKRVVLLAAPAHYESYVRGVATAFGLDAAETEVMMDLLSNAMGTPVREVSLPRRALARSEPALLIHSSDDRAVPIEDSLATAHAWPGAVHQRVEELGHRRLLADKTVVGLSVNFVSTH
jgi:pimeloyl-ACP methyl ester carboxylesterase